MSKLQSYENKSRAKNFFHIQLFRIRQFFTILVFLASMLGANTTPVSAAVSRPGAWAQQYASATYPAGAVNAAYTVAAGSNRLLVVAIASTRTTAGSQTVTNVTYGGQALTLAAGDAVSTGTPNHSYLYYLKEADIQLASGTSLNVTITGGTSLYTWVYAAVYDGVDQTTPFTDAKNFNSGSTANNTVGPFSPTLTIAANDQAIEIVNLSSSSGTTTVRTITTWATGWTTAGVEPAGIAIAPTAMLYIRDRNVLTAADDGSQHTASSASTRDSMTAMSIKPMAGPAITVTGTLSAFSSQPGTPSTQQSYTVSGSNLTANITITAPADFEISTTSGSGFTSSLTLTQSGGTVTATPIYVRLNRATEGASSGNITNASTGATTQNVAVNGTAMFGWIAYNDSAWVSGQTNPANTTTYGISGTTTGLLKNYVTGANTAVTATITSSGGLSLQASTGTETTSGTDAYNTFHNNANMIGVVNYSATAGWYMDVTFTGLDPAKTYTFATSANRAGGTGGTPAYPTRVSRYTVSDATTATNASTSGVTITTTTFANDTSAFITGENTTAGYVARWTGIQPGVDGDFTVRAQSNGAVNEAYGFSVFLLREEAAGSSPTITTTGTLSAFASQPGVASAEQSYSVAGSNLTANIVVTAPADFEVSTTSGSGFGSSVTLTQSGGTVASTPIYVRFNRATAGTSNGNITHSSTGATTQNVAVSGTATEAGTVTFAALGDYGINTAGELAVANLIDGWNPDFIITTGDNTYGSAAPVAPAVSTIDQNIGKYYHNYIGNYIGGFTPGSATNRFFPAIGNHEYTDGGGSTAYFNYFTLPGNERYYEFVQGPVHFFVIDSAPEGPGDGRSAASVQGTWLQAGLAASTSPWKIVYFHHPPFSSSSSHGSDTAMRWPFEAWGATAVLNGHDHDYERVMRDDNSNGTSMPYFVTGAGGNTLYSFGTPVTGSTVRYNSNFGSMRVQASSSNITFEFWSVAGGGTLIDTYTINNSTPTITTTGTLSAFSCQPGTPSAQQSYTVSGSNLTGNITVTAPTDFEVSTTSGSGFASSLALTQSGGTVASTPIYVRFNRATEGSSGGNITHVSTGATTQNVAVSGTASTVTCTPFTENFNSLTVGTRIGQVTGWTESGTASPAVVAAPGGVASTQGLGNGSSIFNWSAHPFLWSDAGLSQVTLQMDFQANPSGAFDDDRLAWMTENTPGSSQYNFGIQLDTDDDGTACASGQNIETYWRNPAFSTVTTDRVETTIACLPTLTGSGWYRAQLIATKLTNTSAKLDVTLTALDASGNPGTVVASGTVTNTSTWSGGAAPAAYFSPSGASTALYPSYKNHNGTTGNADNAVADFCSVPVTQYTLTTNVVGNGSVTLNPAGGTYNAGTVVQVTAVPGSGASFSSWSGDLTGTTNPTTITMTSNKTVTATFIPATTVSFQEGVNSYTGTVDTFIRGTTEGNTNFSASTVLEWDENTGTTTDEIALLRFTNIFSSTGGPIPDGATIVSASLTYKITDLNSGSTALGDPANVYESLVDWPEATVTWNNFGGEVGVQADEYVNLIGSAPATALSTAYTIDVTASLQRWIANQSTNLGWVFLPTAADGVTLYSSKDATVANRPLLTVTYTYDPYTDTSVANFNAGTVGNCVVDNTVGDGALRLNIPSSSSCVFESRIFNAGQGVKWSDLTSTSTLPANTVVSFETRTGNAVNPDASWTPWQAVNSPIVNPGGQYIQYRATLSTSDTNQTPVLQQVTLASTTIDFADLIAPSGASSTWDHTFSWTGVTGATWYYLDLYTAGGTFVYRKWYTAAETNCSGDTSCSFIPTELMSLSNGDYKWRILDYGDGYGYGGWTFFTNFSLNGACYTLTTNVLPASGGALNATTQNCAGGYTAGTIVQLNVVLNEGYILTSWGGDASGTSNPISITMDGNKNVTAYLRGVTLNSPSGALASWDHAFNWIGHNTATWYLLQVQTLAGAPVHLQWYTADVAGCSGGTACSVSPSEMLDLINGDYKWRILDYGGYGYGNWTGFTNFTLNTACYTLTAGVLPVGSGTINATGQNCAGGYTAGTIVHLTAVSNSGFVFDSWSGDAGGTSNPVSVTMNTNKSIIANFRGVALTAPSGTLGSWNNIFSWTGHSTATWYLLQVQTATGDPVHLQWYTSTQAGCSGGSACFVSPVETLNLANGNYKWRILDYGDGYGYGNWTEFTNFNLNQ